MSLVVKPFEIKARCNPFGSIAHSNFTGGFSKCLGCDRLCSSPANEQNLYNAQEAHRPTFSIERIAVPVSGLAGWGIVIVGVLTSLHVVGINIQPLLTVGGVGGVAIGFGAQTVTANIVSGINLVGTFLLLSTSGGGHASAASCENPQSLETCFHMTWIWNPMCQLAILFLRQSSTFLCIKICRKELLSEAEQDEHCARPSAIWPNCLIIILHQVRELQCFPE